MGKGEGTPDRESSDFPPSYPKKGGILIQNFGFVVLVFGVCGFLLAGNRLFRGQIRNPREKSARVANFEPNRSYLDPFRGNFWFFRQATPL